MEENSLSEIIFRVQRKAVERAIYLIRSEKDLLKRQKSNKAIKSILKNIQKQSTLEKNKYNGKE
jgi:hypothetical protein